MLSQKEGVDSLPILKSATNTDTSAGEASVRLPRPQNGVVFVLDLTAAATEVGDTLDVFVQTEIGGQFVDIVHFTQILGNGGTKRFFAKISASEPQAEFENGASLAAGSVRNLIGDDWRIRFDITDAGADNASFTFSVNALVI